MKRDSSSGTTTMLGPNTSAYSGYIFTRTTIIPHGLGYLPMFRAQYEPFGDGVIWNPLTSRLSRFATDPETHALAPGMIAWVDANNMYIQLYYSDATKAAISYPIYYVIYKDFVI